MPACGSRSSRSPTNGWRVIAPQLRGFDGGAGDPPATSVDDYAGDVIDLLDALHVDDGRGRRPVDGRLRRRSRCSGMRRAICTRLILADTKSQGDTPEGVDGRQGDAAARP